MKGSKVNFWQAEQGYALYLVVVISLLILLSLTHSLAYCLNQVQLVQWKDEQLRAHLLLQSAVILWLADLDEAALDNLPEEELIEEWELEEGIVRFYKLKSIHEREWKVRVSARLYQREVRQRVELRIDKRTKQIVHWSEHMS